MEMMILGTGEIVPLQSGYTEREAYRRKVVNFDSEQYIFIDTDINQLHIAQLHEINIGDCYPFKPGNIDACEKMYMLTEDVLLVLGREFIVAATF